MFVLVGVLSFLGSAQAANVTQAVVSSSSGQGIYPGVTIKGVPQEVTVRGKVYKTHLIFIPKERESSKPSAPGSLADRPRVIKDLKCDYICYPNGQQSTCTETYEGVNCSSKYSGDPDYDSFKEYCEEENGGTCTDIEG